MRQAKDNLRISAYKWNEKSTFFFKFYVLGDILVGWTRTTSVHLKMYCRGRNLYHDHHLVLDFDRENHRQSHLDWNCRLIGNFAESCHRRDCFDRRDNLEWMKNSFDRSAEVYRNWPRLLLKPPCSLFRVRRWASWTRTTELSELMCWSNEKSKNERGSSMDEHLQYHCIPR